MHWPLLLLAAMPWPGIRAAEPGAAEDGSEAGHAQVDVRAIFDRFQHRDHDRVFREQGLACVGCHQLGGTGPADWSDDVLDDAWLDPPAASCHRCHNPGPELEAVGPRRCITCHARPPRPDSHLVGWLEQHGDQARLDRRSCRDCHRPSFCVDCHQRKEAIRYRVHDRTWLSVHGIAVRTDPAKCDTCHLQADCVACHTSAGRQ